MGASVLALAPAAPASPTMRYLWKKLRDWILKIRFSTEPEFHFFPD
jgi:hypothetical protein